VTTQASGKYFSLAIQTPSRFTIKVRNLEESLPYYRILLGEFSYGTDRATAIFETGEPPVKVTLIEEPSLPADFGKPWGLAVLVDSRTHKTLGFSRFLNEPNTLPVFNEASINFPYIIEDTAGVYDPDYYEHVVILIRQTNHIKRQ